MVTRNIKKSLNLAFVLLNLIGIVVGQSEMKTQITEREKTQAKLIAKQFSNQLFKEKDISELVSSFFVRNFLEHFQNNENGFPLALFSSEAISKLNAEDRMRLYVVVINSYFLNSLYISTKSPSEIEDMEPKDYFPPRAYEIVANNLKLFEGFSPNNENERNDENSDTLKESITILENYVNNMQNYFRENPAELNKNYQESISSLNKKNHYYEPWLSICDTPCYGYPVGTRLIMVNIPYLQLLLINDGNRLKVLSAMPYS